MEWHQIVDQKNVFKRHYLGQAKTDVKFAPASTTVPTPKFRVLQRLPKVGLNQCNRARKARTPRQPTAPSSLRAQRAGLTPTSSIFWVTHLAHRSSAPGRSWSNSGRRPRCGYSSGCCDTHDRC